MAKSKLLRVAILLSLIFLGAAAVVLLPVKQWLPQFFEWVRGLGAWGPVLLALAYVPECLLMLPGSLLTLGSGFAFGLTVGSVTAWSGSLMGASAAFLTGRYFARDLVESKLSGNPKFQALDRAVAGAGFKIVLLTRLSPLFPFNVLNYAFGLTGIGFRDYVLASAIGMLPGTVLYVYLGSAAKALSDLATV